jgi:hypothetical protein
MRPLIALCHAAEAPLKPAIAYLDVGLRTNSQIAALAIAARAAN